MTKPGVSRRNLPASPFNVPAPPPPQRFAVGDRVSHDQHGLGSIIGVEEDIAVLVDFGSRQHRLTMPCRKLHKL